MLSAARLREVFDYYPETGVLCRKRTTWRNTKAGVVGTLTYYGYLQVTQDGERLLVHRLIWCWVTGEWPAQQIDHRNGQRTDNRWANLREVTPALNSQNRHSAVGAYEQDGRFKASIQTNGKRQYLGRFDTLADAAAAYSEARRAR